MMLEAARFAGTCKRAERRGVAEAKRTGCSHPSRQGPTYTLVDFGSVVDEKAWRTPGDELSWQVHLLLSCELGERVQKIVLARSNRLIRVQIMSFDKMFRFAEVDENTDILIVTLQTKVIHVLSICSLEKIYDMSREIQYA